jgi:hypothetical protein
MPREPIYNDVAGAPYKIGDGVRVVRGTDETFDLAYRGRRGIVAYFEYKCGCGQTYPNDPMIGVRMADGNCAEFWAEELALLAQSRGKPVNKKRRTGT